MPGQISKTYAAPGLRWGLLLEDHPEAYVEFDIVPGHTLGIPASQGADEEFVTATIMFPEHTKRLPVTGYKPMLSKIGKEATGGSAGLDHPSDRITVLRTKALGRALKRAGYPDDIVDLRALVVWRTRDAEIGAIKAGTANLSLGQSSPEAAIEAAGRRSPEHVGGDDTNGPDDNDGDDGDQDGDDGGDSTLVPPTEETKAKVRGLINGLGPRSSEMNAWCKTQGIKMSRPESEADARKIVAKAETMAAQEPAGAPEPVSGPDHPSDPAGDAPAPTGEEPGDPGVAGEIQELVLGLSAEENRMYVEFLPTIGADPTVDPSKWSAQIQTEVLVWLSVDGSDSRD